MPYMLIDCAGIDGGEQRIPAQIFSELQSLFTGDLAVELADVGPYLGQLNSWSDAVADVVQDLLDRHVGMLVLLKDAEPDKAEVGFTQLHRHFRKFNVVYDPSGKPLFFRYYDPRALVDVLAVLDAKQLEAFFGPVETLVLSDSDGQAVRCQRWNGKLAVQP